MLEFTAHFLAICSDFPRPVSCNQYKKLATH